MSPVCVSVCSRTFFFRSSQCSGSLSDRKCFLKTGPSCGWSPTSKTHDQTRQKFPKRKRKRKEIGNTLRGMTLLRLSVRVRLGLLFGIYLRWLGYEDTQTCKFKHQVDDLLNKRASICWKHMDSLVFLHVQCAAPLYSLPLGGSANTKRVKDIIGRRVVGEFWCSALS